MAIDGDPRLLLVALSLLHEPDDGSFKTMRSVHNMEAKAVSRRLEELRLQKVAMEEQLQLTPHGIAFLRARLSPILLVKGARPASIYRAFVGGVLLSQVPDAETFKSLSNGRCVCAAIAAGLHKPGLDMPFDSPKRLIALATRIVVMDFLVQHVPGLKLTPPTGKRDAKDPLIEDLFAAATGCRDVDAGFRKLAAKALNASSIPKTEARWRSISKAGFDSMARSVSRLQQEQVEISALVSAVDQLSRSTPTGWVPIFRVFETYRSKHRVALVDFKAAVEAAARSDQLELAPLNVPSLQNANERAQSALVMGGLTYHLVRLPK